MSLFIGRLFMFNVSALNRVPYGTTAIFHYFISLEFQVFGNLEKILMTENTISSLLINICKI